MDRLVTTRVDDARHPAGTARTAPVLHCDLRRRVTAVNGAAERLLGRSDADLRGAPVESLAPPDARTMTAAELAVRMYDRPGTWGTVDFVRGGDRAEPLRLEVSCRPLPDSAGYAVELRSPTGPPKPASLLSEREREVFVRVAAGRTGAEIAAELFLAPATIERHVANALRKLGAQNRPHGVALALRAGALDDEHVAGAPSTEALRETIETFEDPAALLRIDGSVLIVNEAWRALGREALPADVGVDQNYLGAYEHAAADDDDAARAAAGLREVLEDRAGSFSMEYRYAAAGAPHWFRLHAVRHPRTDGAAVLVRHRDLTPLRLAERQARLGAAFLDGLEAATFVYTEDGTVTAWMPGAERLLGWTPAEAVGRPVWELFLGRRNWPAGRAIVEAVVRNGRWSGELEFERRDGSTFFGHVRDRLVATDDRSSSKVVGVVTDVTERRSAERAASVASHALYELSETIRDGWILTDAVGRIVHANGPALRLLGREERDLVGHGIERIVQERPPGRPARRDAGPRPHAPDGRREVRRERMLRGDGEVLLVDYVATATTPAEHRDGGGAGGGGGWNIVFWKALDP